MMFQLQSKVLEKGLSMRNSIVLPLFLISSASTQNVWTQMQKIETDDNTGWFGTSVDISGNAMYMIGGAMR